MPKSKPAKPASRRRAGRPGRDDVDLRARLLDAAAVQFGRTGIEGSSLRAIAVAAGVTPAMLHYYFGDKARLTQALIDERLMPAMQPMRARLEQVGDDPMALVTAFAQGIAEIVAEHPWLPPLWVREVLCEGATLREIVFRQVVPMLPQWLAGRFAAAQAAGRMNPALDPRLMVVSLVGLTLFPAAGAPVWKQAMGAEPLGPDVLVRHTLALLASGIGPTPTDARGTP